MCVAAPKIAKAILVLAIVTDILAKNFTNVHDHVLSVTATRTVFALATLDAATQIGSFIFLS
jgi:hypothetical protein